MQPAPHTHAIHVDGGYPVDITDNLAELLRMAQHNEYEEHDDVYKNFGDKAKEEGFLNGILLP